MNSVILIPARMESSRFPNKPLALILGKPMIQWVYEAAEKSDATDVFIVTDSQEIIDVVDAFGGQFIRTSETPRNGTERCLEAMEILDADGEDYDVIINVQGDEPLLSPKDINNLINLFEEDDIDIVTLLKPITNEGEYRDPNVVKAVPSVFEDGYCDICYFSRSPIPYMDEFETKVAFKHIGIYGFTVTAFEEVKNLNVTEAEHHERLEQLRWLQNHILISGIVTNTHLVGVDTPEDLKTVEEILKSR
jgi:3-deoxy-manno-octulosonate cytidylyltransferase (CMP-KDO synthetase)